MLLSSRHGRDKALSGNTLEYLRAHPPPHEFAWPQAISGGGSSLGGIASTSRSTVGAHQEESFLHVGTVVLEHPTQDLSQYAFRVGMQKWRYPGGFLISPS